jgi:6-phosphogluconolactonase (cycloisomerase 2 family)
VYLQLKLLPSLATGLIPWLTKGMIISILLTACADSRGKKSYIDGLESDRYNKSITQAYQSGHLVQLIDQNGTLRSVALKDVNGDGVADGIDLNNDGNLDIRLLTGNETRVSPWAFITPIDIDNNGVTDYFLYFNTENHTIQIKFLIANNSNTLPLKFLINGSNQITGLDNTGDAVSDDPRLTGLVIVSAGSAPDSTPPSQPGTPGGASAGTTQLDLSWTAATDDSSSAANISYEICQFTTAGGCSTFTATYSVAAGQTNYSATGLTALTTYYYTIRSRDASGNYGTPSGEFSATTAALGTVNNPTYAPVAGVFGVAQNVTISTSTAGAAICYTVDGVTTPACDATALCTAGATYFSAVNVSVTTNMQAIACKLGNTASSVVSGTFTIDTTGPSVPGSFAALPASTTQIDLSWVASTDAVTAQANIVYEICQTTTSGACSPFAVSYTTGAGATNYSATGLNPLTTYYFVVRAKDSVNNAGTATGEISATTNAAGTVANPTYSPVAGTYGTAQNIAIGSVTPGATVCYTTDGVTAPVCNAAAVCTTGSTYGSAINTAVTTTYRAIGCKVGYTASGVAAGVFTIDTTPPVPGNSGTLTTSGITTSAITVDWTAGTDNVDAATSLQYLLYYSTSNNLGSVVAIEANGTAVGSYATNIITQAAGSLTAGTTYYFAVIVKDLMGNKAAYGVVSGVTSANAADGFAYTANYTSNDITMYTMNSSTGILTANGTISTGTAPYGITTDPTGRFVYTANSGSNNVSAYAIDASTGTLVSSGTTAAGTSPYAVAVDPTGRFAYSANYNGNNISMFTINASTGTLTANGSIAAGTNPSFITIHPSGLFAYATNDLSSNISMYTINQSTGLLTSNGTIAAVSNPFNIKIDRTGQYAYVTCYGSNRIRYFSINQSTGTLSAINFISTGNNPAPIIIDPTGRFAFSAGLSNTIESFAINFSTGALTSNGTIATGANPWSISVDAAGRFLYVTDAIGFTNQFSINSSSGVLAANGSIAAGSQPYAITVARKPRFAYVANSGNAEVVLYTINASTGALTANGTVATGSGPYTVTVDTTGRFAYVPNYTSGNVSLFTINPSTGALVANGTIAAGTNPTALALDPSGRFAYVANNGSNNVSMYTVNATTGVLSANGTIAAGTQPISVTVNRSGRFAYVANSGGNTVSSYTVNASTGVLTASGTIAAGTTPRSITVDPSGRFAYVANSGSNNVSMYTINATTGVLTANGTIAAGTSAYSVAVDPSGRFAYVANSASSTVSMYTINTSTGALTANGTIASGLNAYSVTADAGGRFAYVANNNGVSMYTIDAATGTLTANGTIAAGGGLSVSVTAW